MDEELIPHLRQIDIGFQMSVREWRPNKAIAERRPFLLVHGLSSNARTWDGVAAELSAAGHPVVAIDQRGHGRSEKPPISAGYDFRHDHYRHRQCHPCAGAGNVRSSPANPGVEM